MPLGNIENYYFQLRHYTQSVMEILVRESLSFRDIPGMPGQYLKTKLQAAVMGKIILLHDPAFALRDVLSGSVGVICVNIF